MRSAEMRWGPMLRLRRRLSHGRSHSVARNPISETVEREQAHQPDRLSAYVQFAELIFTIRRDHTCNSPRLQVQ